APVCKPGQKTTYGVGKNEAVHIPCEVIAFPLKLRYRWALNLTSDSGNGSKSHTVFESSQSTLSYIPRSKADFGTLLCWATNDIGTQAQPCVYLVIAADIPDPVYNCTVYNQTVSSFYVVCMPGYDGGLSQSFVMNIHDSIDGQLKSTLTSPRALFYVSGLNSGMKLSLKIYSSNSKGRSDAVELQAQTKEVDDKNDEVVLDMMQMLLVLTGVVIALSLVAIAVVVIMRCRISQNKKQRDCLREQAQRSNILLHKEADGSVDTDEKCPDVIPSNGREVTVLK
uniref:Ig-like domain-containing protein n=1 Tax=Strigamia maritima TaxID=126957 RepID=T1IYU4_STRMM